MQTINDRKCLASWAVFKQLCDEGHKNIYEVLRDFIKATIYRNSLRSFTAASLTEQVNKDYEFDLKAAVVVQAIKELSLQKDPRTREYKCDPNDYAGEDELSKKIEESTSVNNEIIDGLFAYIEKVNGVVLNESEKEAIIKSLIHYLLNNSYEDSYSTLISAYILRCRQDARLSMALINILEGVVRYVGVKFDSPDKASSHWTSEMTVYLDTEILFHMAGYNGSLYKQLFDDFYELVDEINKDSMERRQHKLINLKYFDYVTDEINSFFDRAIDIINGKLTLNPAVTAMKEITLGCKTESEIAEKKGLFLEMIDGHEIEPDNNSTDFYHSSQFSYNLEGEALVKKFCEENKYKCEEFVQESLLSLSHINVLRQGVSNRSFENLGYVLLTDNYITEKLAWMDGVKGENDRPLCTSLYFLTNRMWYRLGKSFGKNVTPKVFDVISKAQIILSNKINDSVYSQYVKLVERFEKKEVSIDGAKEVLYQLRSQVKNPEEIDTTSEVDDAMASVGEPELQKYIQEAEYRKSKQLQIEEENERLNKLNEQVTARNEEVQRQNETVRKENESIKQENETIRQENERVKAESTQTAAQLENTTQKYAALEMELKKAREKQYNSDMELYTRNLDDYIKIRKRETVWQLILYFIFLVVSCILSYFTIKYEKWTGLPDGLRIIILVVLGQIVPVIRAKVTKISLRVLWKVIFRKDVSVFVNEYKKDNLEPTLPQ